VIPAANTAQPAIVALAWMEELSAWAAMTAASIVAEKRGTVSVPRASRRRRAPAM
jgi:hypothetical protein